MGIPNFDSAALMREAGVLDLFELIADGRRSPQPAPGRKRPDGDAGVWTRDVGPVLAEVVLETIFGRG
jgi:hypothetical protein